MEERESETGGGGAGKGGRVAKEEVHHLEFKVIQKESRKMITVLRALKHIIWRGCYIIPINILIDRNN